MSFSHKEKYERLLAEVRRPGRYIGGEWNEIVKTDAGAAVRMVLAFPDVYEVGMSNLGLQIIYDLVNKEPGYACERVFAPWVDMEESMRRQAVPLSSLESRTPIKEFDVVGFSLQYELTMTNVLNMLELAGVAVRAEDRSESAPLVIGGGPCVFNPEPMAAFFDALVIGEGEEVILEILRIVEDAKKLTAGRAHVLGALAGVEGVYVPALYKYESVYPLRQMAQESRTVKKRLIVDFDRLSPPTRPIVPFLETVHDRCVIEVMRGCTRGCRFCQAGIIYRPTRERSAESVVRAVDTQLENTGYDEVSLASLSTTDHSEIGPILAEITKSSTPRQARSVSLPSLRTDQFSVELARQISSLKKTGLTFAPEAGSERLRGVINKGLSEKDIIDTALKAFGLGWARIKLYFMIGLPTETDEDVVAIAELAKLILEHARGELGRKIAGRLRITVNVSTFVPKAHTPFQWIQSLSIDDILRRQQLLRDNLKMRQIDLKWHDAHASIVEGALARGGREVATAIENAYMFGARFDGWSEHFSFDIWNKAFDQAGLDIVETAAHERRVDKPLPWDHIDVGVTKKWLLEEYRKGISGRPTSDCRHGDCAKCGACKGDIKMRIASER